MYSFGTGTLFAIPQTDRLGAAVSDPDALQFGSLQEVSGDISFDLKQLHGRKSFPLAVARGKGKAEFKAKNAGINARSLEFLFGAASSTGVRRSYVDQLVTVPAEAPYTINADGRVGVVYVSDLGVKYATSGLVLRRDASGFSGTTMRYSVGNGGVYTFGSGDAGKQVLISYECTETSTNILGPRYAVIDNPDMGLAHTFKVALQTYFKGKSLSFVLNACTSSKLSMQFKNDDFMIPEFEFSAFADDAGELGYWGISE